MANTFDEYDIESQKLLQGLQFLDLKQQAGSLQRTLPLINSNSSRSFEVITFDNKFGNQIEKCGEYKDEFYRSALNSKKLIEDLKVNSNSDDFFFHYKEYTKNLPTTTLILSGDGLGPRLITEHEQTIPYQYENAQGKRETAALKIRLNTRACKVDFINPGFRFKIDEKNESLNFQISFIYTDAIDKRDFSITPEIDNDYVLNDMYKAIIIETEKLNDFVAIVSQIGRETFLEDKITKVFADKLKNSKEASELKFLYENMPDFALKNILSLLNEEILWEHINVLTDYDDDGLFSGWRDGSSALINVMKAYGKSNILFDKFKANPAFVKRIYKNLDGSSFFEEQQMSNRIIFSNLLYALCASNGFKELTITDKTFFYGEEYKYDANVTSIGNNEKEDEFFIQQLRLIPLFGADYTPFKDELPLDYGAMYHPLEMVYLLDVDSKDSAPKLVPAIYIKALSDEVEIQEIEKNIRIGFDVLAIVLGVIAIATTGNPGVLALAIADVGLATTDVAVQTFKEEILQLEGGAEFLASWEKIYLVGGIVSAGPAAINGILKGGAKLLLLAKTAKNFNALNFLRACVLKVILEIEIASFTKNTVKFFANETELILATKGVLNDLKVGELLKKGVIIVTGEVKTKQKVEEQIALIYKDEAIIRANSLDFAKASKDIIKNLNHKDKFFEVCENIINRRKVISLKDAELLGQAPKSGVKMLFTLIDELGNNIGQLSRSPNRNELYYKLIQKGKEIDIKCYMKLLDDKYKLNDLPIKNGEHLLYGDFNIPKEITNKLSGIGQIIYEDGLKYFLRAKKYGKVDGTVSIWEKSNAYTDYGGQSINLNQFWKAFDKGMSYEQAAFETFAGKQAKKFGFTKVRTNINHNIVTRDKVQINFLQ
ncbi:conserved hypothetical protein [Flavobacterium sp. 9AF]|uniref:hypothetical protein n=1 Tax=Flavobacterium sp. 9AF TaxID=2653142 RepID=UPI0012F01BC7|nr:hypothetical protein [Flavobacterium sp. 9AF]VXB82545.1 conserved hypothetical protein [Flavobacterium sp. 9AF]